MYRMDDDERTDRMAQAHVAWDSIQNNGTPELLLNLYTTSIEVYPKILPILIQIG